ncbi:hypothetical protein HBA_0899 [Sodalis endosymbiont of Henestaris halophilus]|nr:hypothetical protein HBA_0899 [Sodalis endosymbiont of Henestaris halophilus]
MNVIINLAPSEWFQEMRVGRYSKCDIILGMTVKLVLVARALINLTRQLCISSAINAAHRIRTSMSATSL